MEWWWWWWIYFCGMVDRWKVCSLISSRGHCQRYSPSQISDTPRAGFEPAQNLSSVLVEWSYAVVKVIHYKIRRRKATVCKWNLIRHGKSNYTNLLWEMSGIKNEDEYFLQCVKQLAAYVKERENLFDWREILIKNLKTGAKFKEKSSYFILNRFSEWKVAYEKFRKERLEINKSTKLFDTIPKSTSSFKKGKPWKTPDKKEETINFLWPVDYARLQGFDVEYLMISENVASSYYLTKDGELRKSPKSEWPCSTNVSKTSLKRAIFIDLMLEWYQLKRSGALWKTFSYLSKGCTRTDIDFDPYLQHKTCISAHKTCISAIVSF